MIKLKQKNNVLQVHYNNHLSFHSSLYNEKKSSIPTESYSFYTIWQNYYDRKKSLKFAVFKFPFDKVHKINNFTFVLSKGNKAYDIYLPTGIVFMNCEMKMRQLIRYVRHWI